MFSIFKETAWQNWTNCGLPCIRSNQHPGSPQTRWLENVDVVSREACLRYNAIPNVLFIERWYRSVMQFDDVVRIQRGEHVHIFQLWPGCSKKHARHHVLALTATNGPLANILLKTTGNSHIFCFFCLSFSFPFFFFNQFSKSLSQGLFLVCVYCFLYAVLLRLHAVCVLLAKSLPSWQKTNLRGGILPKCDFLNIETEFEWHTCCRKLPELHKQFLVPLPKKTCL